MDIARTFDGSSSRFFSATLLACGLLLGGPQWLNGAPNTPETVAPNVLRIGNISNNAIDESSGLIASRRFGGVFWTHNDRGNSPRLFAITRKGKTLGTYRIQNTNLDDWEDIAVDDNGNLYLADIGSGNGNRKHLYIHRVTEPNPYASGRIDIAQTWKVKFPRKAFDAESFFVGNGNGFIITKDRPNGQAVVFRFPLSWTQNTVTLQPITTLDVAAPITGADLSRDKRRLGLITDEGAYVLFLEGGIPTAGSARKVFSPFQHPQMEGGCFAGDGFLVSAESGDIYLYNRLAFRAN